MEIMKQPEQRQSVEVYVDVEMRCVDIGRTWSPFLVSRLVVLFI